jgi:hypothetical protein
VRTRLEAVFVTQDSQSIDDAPYDLANAIREFWPSDQWDAAASIAYLESGWQPFALADSTDADHPCGTPVGDRDGVVVTAERSIGYFQINSCNFPAWEWQRLYNGRHNAGTAHMLWASRGWQPWFFSARSLGFL